MGRHFCSVDDGFEGSLCGDCRRKYQRERCRTDTPTGVRQRERQIQVKYQISVDDYRSLLEEQGGVCAICQRAPRTELSLAVDHDHRCCPDARSCGKCVRGLLCRPCNSAIGLLGDAPDVLIRAAEYLATRR